MQNNLLNTLNQRIKIFIFFLVAGISINYPSLFMHYSTDSYDMLFNQPSSVPFFSACGRPLTGIIFYILSKIGVNTVAYQTIFTLLLIVVFSYCAFSLYIIVKELSKKEIPGLNLLFAFSSFLIVFNVFHIEVYTFSFALIASSLALLCVIISVKISINDINIKKLLLVLVLLCSSLSLYQIWGALYLPLVLIILAFKYSSDVKLLVTKTFMFGFIYALAALSNFIYIKLIHPLFSSMSNGRALNSIDFVNNIKTIIKAQKAVWVDQFGMLPQFTILAFIFVFIIILCIATKKFNIADFRYTAIISALSITFLELLVFLPHMVTSTVWIVPRAITPIASVPGLLLLILALFIPFSEDKLSIYKTLISISLIISIVFGVLLYNTSQRIAIDNIATNKIDREIAKQVMYLINKQETISNKQVTKIMVYHDKYISYFYEGILCYGDMNIKAFSALWSIGPLLKQVSGRDFIVSYGDEDDAYGKIFKEKDWTTFSPEQVIVKDDIAHIAIF